MVGTTPTKKSEKPSAERITKFQIVDISLLNLFLRTLTRTIRVRSIEIVIRKNIACVKKIPL